MLKISGFILILLTLNACSLNPFKSKEPEDTKITNNKKKKRAVYNVREKIDSQQSGIIFGKKESDKFGNQNILWRATLETLDFMPISNADYSGGIISTDWYSDAKSDESIKISVSFSSKEIRSSSISVKSFKRKCENLNKCVTSKLNDQFNRKIKDQIIEKVKKLKINEDTKK